MTIITNVSYAIIITAIFNNLLNKCFDKFYCIPIDKLMNDIVDELNRIKDHSNSQIPDKIEIKEHSIFTLLLLLLGFIFLANYFIMLKYNLAVIIGVSAAIILSIIHISASHALYGKIIITVENIMKEAFEYDKQYKNINTDNFAAIYLNWIDKLASIELFRTFLIAALVFTVIFGIFL